MLAGPTSSICLLPLVAPVHQGVVVPARQPNSHCTSLGSLRKEPARSRVATQSSQLTPFAGSSGPSSKHRPTNSDVRAHCSTVISYFDRKNGSSRTSFMGVGLFPSSTGTQPDGSSTNTI